MVTKGLKTSFGAKNSRVCRKNYKLKIDKTLIFLLKPLVVEYI